MSHLQNRVLHLKFLNPLQKNFQWQIGDLHWASGLLRRKSHAPNHIIFMTYGLGTKMYMSVEVVVQNIWIFCLAFPQNLRLCAVRNHQFWEGAVHWIYFGVSFYAVAQREKLIILLGMSFECSVLAPNRGRCYPLSLPSTPAITFGWFLFLFYIGSVQKADMLSVVFHRFWGCNSTVEAFGFQIAFRFYTKAVVSPQDMTKATKAVVLWGWVVKPSLLPEDFP